MKRTGLLTALCLTCLLGLSLNCFADDLSAQASLLEQKVQRLQNQIDQAKATNQNVLNQQIQSLRTAIDAYVKQRVQIDSQIASMEGQIQDLTAKSQETLARQINIYTDDLQKTKAQLSSILAEKGGQPTANQSGQAQ
jgi:chromosome segregation ATPase